MHPILPHQIFEIWGAIYQFVKTTRCDFDENFLSKKRILYLEIPF